MGRPLRIEIFSSGAQNAVFAGRRFNRSISPMRDDNKKGQRFGETAADVSIPHGNADLQLDIKRASVQGAHEEHQ
jgi:hypothetical protein